MKTESYTEVVFLMGGRFLLEEQRQRLDPCGDVEWPRMAAGMRWDLVTTKSVVADGETFTKTDRVKGPVTWRGALRTYEDVIRDDPDSILARNMESNGYRRVVDGRFGCHVMAAGDTVVADEETDG